MAEAPYPYTDPNCNKSYFRRRELDRHLRRRVDPIIRVLIRSWRNPSRSPTGFPSCRTLWKTSIKTSLFLRSTKGPAFPVRMKTRSEEVRIIIRKVERRDPLLNDQRIQERSPMDNQKPRKGGALVRTRKEMDEIIRRRKLQDAEKTVFGALVPTREEFEKWRDEQLREKPDGTHK